LNFFKEKEEGIAAGVGEVKDIRDSQKYCFV